MPFGDASRLEPGDEVVAIGYALGLSGEATITRGIVSAMRYVPDYRSDVIQTDAAINPGNSGGPMLSMAGEILGINTFGIDKSIGEGLNFAISEGTVRARIPALKTARAAPTPTPTGRPPSDGSFLSLSTNETHTCAVKTSGSVICWGEEHFLYSYGQATPPAGSFASVSAGSGHTCGVRTNGSVSCWGRDDDGQATPPPGSFASVSAGYQGLLIVRKSPLSQRERVRVRA